MKQHLLRLLSFCVATTLTVTSIPVYAYEKDAKGNSIEEIEYAILEGSGTLSVFPYANDKSPLPLPLILDGDIQLDTIKNLKKDKKWVYDFLDKKDIKLQDVFFAFYKDKNIFIIKNDDLI